MTCLAVLQDKKGVLYFAGDRKISWGSIRSQASPRPKIAYKAGVLLAGAGASCICEAVVDQFIIPLMSDENTYDYMHNVFMPALFKHLTKEGWMDKGTRKLKTVGPAGQEDDLSAVILVGVLSDLYSVNIDHSVITVDAVNTPYAEGSGGVLAIGSLLTTEYFKISIIKRLKIALGIAAKHSPGCGDGVDILSNKDLFYGE